MFLYKRNNGFYYIIYTRKNGKRTCKSTKCKIKIQARRIFKEFRNKQIVNPTEYIDITLIDFINEYLRYSGIFHTRKTTLTYKTTFNKLLTFIHCTMLSEITTEMIEEFIKWRVKKGSIYS